MLFSEHFSPNQSNYQRKKDKNVHVKKTLHNLKNSPTSTALRTHFELICASFSTKIAAWESDSIYNSPKTVVVGESVIYTVGSECMYVFW